MTDESVPTRKTYVDALQEEIAALRQKLADAERERDELAAKFAVMVEYLQRCYGVSPDSYKDHIHVRTSALLAVVEAAKAWREHGKNLHPYDLDGFKQTPMLIEALMSAVDALKAGAAHRRGENMPSTDTALVTSLRTQLAAAQKERDEIVKLRAVVEAAKAVNWNAVYYALGDDDFCKFGLDDLRVAFDALKEGEGKR